MRPLTISSRGRGQRKVRSAAIDDPMDAFGQQYIGDEPELPAKLARYAADLGYFSQ